MLDTNNYKYMNIFKKIYNFEFLNYVFIIELCLK